jgi:phage terminase large subunit
MPIRAFQLEEELGGGLDFEIDTLPVFRPLLLPARYKGAFGGRGSGKSHYFAEALVELCIERQPTSFACLREFQKNLKFSAKRLVEEKIRAFGATASFHIKESDIGTPGGGVLIFQGLQNHTAEGLQSLENFDGAWCEEARSLSDRSFEVLTPTFRKENSELWFSWNPVSPKDPVDKFFRGMPYDSNGYNKEADARLVKANWYNNEWLTEVLRKEKDLALRRNKERYAHIWLGEYRAQSDAQVFKHFEIADFESPDDARFLFGADWGFSVDPSVLVRMFVGRWEPHRDHPNRRALADRNGRTLFIDREAYKIGCEIDHLPALFAGDDRWHSDGHPLKWKNPYRWQGIPGAHDWPIIADSARADTISYLHRRGFRMEPAIKGRGSIEDGIEFLQSYDIVIHESECPHSAEEFTMYTFEVDEHTNEVLPILSEKNNHVIDAARYALEKTRRSGISMVDYLD